MGFLGKLFFQLADPEPIYRPVRPTAAIYCAAQPHRGSGGVSILEKSPEKQKTRASRWVFRVIVDRIHLLLFQKKLLTVVPA
jgi:hypothetical protein